MRWSSPVRQIKWIFPGPKTIWACSLVMCPLSRRCVVLGGVAELSRDELAILADAARRIDDFDILGLRAEIEERERGLRAIPLARELDREIALLDHYKTLHRHLTATTAF